MSVSQIYSFVQSEISTAELGRATESIGLRLLRKVHPDNGYIGLSWGDAECLTGVSKGRFRWHLGELKSAGIIHYSTNGHVYISFLAWLGSAWIDHPRAKSDHVRAENDLPRAVLPMIDHPRAEIDHGRAKNDHPRAVSPHTVCMSVYTPPIDEDTNIHVQNHTEADGPQGGSQERADCLALLAEVGINNNLAEGWLDEHACKWIERQVFAYLSDREGGRANGTGALCNRIRQRWNAPALSAADKSTDLYLQTHPEYAAEQRDEQAWMETSLHRAHELAQHRNTVVPALGEDEQMIQAILCRRLRVDPASCKWTISLVDDQLTISATGRDEFFLKRLQPKLERELSCQLGRSIRMTICESSEEVSIL